MLNNSALSILKLTLYNSRWHNSLLFYLNKLLSRRETIPLRVEANLKVKNPSKRNEQAL